MSRSGGDGVAHFQPNLSSKGESHVQASPGIHRSSHSGGRQSGQSPDSSSNIRTGKENRGDGQQGRGACRKQGRAAFAEFRKPDSEWWFGNTYIFAYDQKLNVLLNPAFPKREGANPQGQKDANGKAFHDEFLKVVQTKGSGWVDYMFPKPGQTQPSQKWSYVKAVQIDGTPGIIGAGFYPD